MLDSIVAAPVYGVNGSSTEAQQAYALYRQAIDRANTTAATLHTCGQGSSTIETTELGDIRRRLVEATALFGQAADLTRPTVNQMPANDLFQAVERAHRAVVSLGASLDRATGSGNAEACEPILADFAVLEQSPAFDMAAQSSNAQSAYGLYRQAVSDVLSKAGSLLSVCQHGGGSLSPNDYGRTRIVLKDAEGLLISALALIQP
jgi:hypothetical protein